MPIRDVPRRLQAIVALIDGMIEQTHGQAFDHIRGNFLYERAIERVIELIADESETPDAVLGLRHPGAELAPVLALSEKLLDNDYRIDTYDMWQLLTRQLPALKAAIVPILTDYTFEI